MLIESSEVQRTAQRTLRYWMLLALRILLLMALVLAFAQPLLPRRAVPVVNPDARVHAIVLDTSLSMQYGDHWQQALQQARQIIDAAVPGDQLLLIEASGHRIQVLQNAVNPRQAQTLRAELDRIQPGSERLDYGWLMTTARGWLGSLQLPAQPHLITERQQSSSPLPFADLETPTNVSLGLQDVGAAAGNTYRESAKRVGADRLAIEVRTSATEVLKRDLIVAIDGNET